nr:lipolytic enzyme [uncultured bacterium]
MADRSDVAPRPPRARTGDAIRVPAAALASAVAALGRRAVGRKRRPAWSARLEATIAAYRGSWSTMPALGIVRWRNVGEALSRLRTDGLRPRFTRFESGQYGIQGTWLEPAGASGAVLLYFHGGGFCFGSIRTHGPLIGALARAARARTFAAEYRLAPEHTAPAAHDDALSAYRHLLGEGIAPRQIVLAGDSSGGTLVLSTLLALRDAGEAMPAAGIAISPWVDLSCSGASFKANAPFDFVGEPHCRLAAVSYLGAVDPRRPDISPLFADLRGLPPLLIQAGGAEVLVDQIRAFAGRARDAGVDVTLSVYDDMVHVWHLMRDVTRDGQRAIDEAAAFARAHAS